MSDSTETYIRERIAKAAGKIIEGCEDLAGDCRNINSDNITEEQLVMFDEQLSQLANNLSNARVITALIAVCSSSDDTVNTD